MTLKKRIFSGVKASSSPTLGNYLGAIKNWVDMQNADTSSDILFFIPDLHAITVPYEVDEIKDNIHHIAAAYIASGVDITRSTLFLQSHVPAHCELMWLLATMTQMGKLDRMTQFKDKAGKNTERAGLGLYAYPVLMAADILLYKATHIPVGEDQTQHVELTRDIASTFNHRYGVDFFPLPEAVVNRQTMRIMSLRDGTKKMSKSDESDFSRINLIDDADLIAQKIKRAKTDPLPFPVSMEECDTRPEAKNLLSIYAALSGIEAQSILNDFGGKSFSAFKDSLTDVTVSHMAPITQKMRDLMASPDEIDRILIKGGEKARAIAAPVLADVRYIMGFRI